MSSSGGNWDFGSEGGYQPSSGPAERLGLTRVGAYEIEGEVARGGMGVVYRGRDTRLGRPVAIKFLLASGTKANQAHVRRFTREAESLGGLSHPGLLAVYDFGVSPESEAPYMVTEWLEGETLQAKLQRAGTLSVAESLDLMEAISRAVAYAHEQGVLHRDLKPSNVVLAPRGPVVIDFGLAKRQDLEKSRLTQTGSMAGTAGFAAPEQMSDAARVDERADVYGLAATLYALLTGFPPGGEGGQHLLVLAANATGKFPLPGELRPDVPRGVDRLLRRGLARDPEGRISDAGELADAIAQVGAIAARRPRWAPLVMALAALIALGIGVGKTIGVLWGPESPQPTQGEPAGSPAASPTQALPPKGPRQAAALEAELKALEDELAEAPVEAAALRAIYERGARLCERLLEVAQAPGQRWLVARHYVTSGRVELATPLLRDLADEPGFVARANLELVWLALTRRSTEGVGPALRRAASAEGVEVDPDEELARRMASALDRARQEGLDASGASLVRLQLEEFLGEARGPWRQRSIWGTCFFSAFLAPARYRTQIGQAWGTPRPGKPELALPRFSTISTWHLGLASGNEPNVAQELGYLFDAHAERINSDEFYEGLARGYASAGSRGGLERTLRRLSSLPPAVVERHRRQVRLMAEARGGQVQGQLRAAALGGSEPRPRVEWLRIRCEPSQRLLGVWLSIPEGIKRWGVRLSGAEVDFDLRLRKDGPPKASRKWDSTATTMARNERLEARGPGLYFLQIDRATPWPTPLELALELETCGPGEELSLGQGPWEFPLPTIETPGLREAFAKSRTAFADGRLDAALAVLDPFLERSPQARVVRWSTLDYAARWEELNLGVRDDVRDAGDRGRLAAWLMGRSHAAIGNLKEAEESFAQLVRQAPELALAWEELVLARAGLRDEAGASQALVEARRRQPSSPTLELMELALRGPEHAGAFASRFHQLEGHAHARQRAIALLFFLSRGGEALPLLGGLPVDLRDQPREVILRAYANLSLGRVGHARALLESLKEADLSPALRRELGRAKRSIR